MHLINTSTLGLHEFGRYRAPYAILSHTWREREPTYQDLLNFTGDDGAESNSDFSKVQSCASLARQDGVQYLWIDTCCIDKMSSAELSEVTNSMFRWCQEATKCYVYLSDVTFDDWERHIRSSRWFTRAWTLQELIAPRTVEFYSSDWQRIGDKISLESLIHDITGVPVSALRGAPMKNFTVAERMSWVTHRASTRPEDKAYSLLGIFDVNMPVIYGEGTKAFQRLRDEISKTVSISQGSQPNGIRLLATRSDPLRVETVRISQDLQYAILSHTWGDDEVLFDDMRLGTAEQRRGYSKVRKCCDLAAKDGFDYVWIDTCCIDKSSSSELQEAICSMYKWYKNARVCYAYLEDCEYQDQRSFVSSRWFTRGWTLQELIAPAIVEFYDQNWIEIGTKQSLCEHIAQITSIDPYVLRGADPTDWSVAERMSWASLRSTTREEDEAYSLMGLFDVFMPMLYGEGKRAFVRLQEEIIKQTEDHTIFCWKAKTEGSRRGIFAHSPSEFSTVKRGLITFRSSSMGLGSLDHSPPAMSSRGLTLTLPLSKGDGRSPLSLGWVSSCQFQEDEDEDPTILCIWLEMIQSFPTVYARIFPEKLEPRPMANHHQFEQQTIYVLPSTISRSEEAGPVSGEIIIHPLNNHTQRTIDPILVRIADWAQWLSEDKIVTHFNTSGDHTLAVFRFDTVQSFLVVIGSHAGSLWCSIIAPEELQQRGWKLKDLIDMQIAHFCPNATDRARKKLPSGDEVAAAVRVEGSAHRATARFSLHTKLSSSPTNS